MILDNTSGEGRAGRVACQTRLLTHIECLCAASIAQRHAPATAPIRLNCRTPPGLCGIVDARW